MALLTVKQASKLLNIAPATVYALVSEGKIRAHRFGLKRGTIRITEEELHRYQDAALVEPTSASFELKHLQPPTSRSAITHG